MYSPRGGGGGEGAYSTLGRGEGGYSTLGRSEGYGRRGEESGNFYESDSGVSSLYEPVSFVNQHSLDHSINQVNKEREKAKEKW